MKLAFSHIQVYVNDLNRAIEWYGRMFNCQPQYVAAPHYAALSAGNLGCDVALHAAHDNKDVGKGPMPYLTSDDFDRTIATLRDKGITVAEPRREGGSPRFTQFTDSEGNLWGLEEAS